MNQLASLLSHSLGFFVFIPLAAFVTSLFWRNKEETPIARIVLFAKAAYIGAAVVYAVLWCVNGGTPVAHRLVTLYQTDRFVFAIQFYYDLVTLVYSVVGAVLFFLVSTFSRYYMHRDEGYKRFFNTILFFAVGYNFIVFSGNFETLFVGWEIIGLSSFLLIAFYRNRYLPVKNAFKIISNYRLSDVALILAMWMLHHLTHRNVSFTELAEAKTTAVQSNHPGMAVFIVLMILLAATIKSAQLPFTSWLPRAMEGPTTSSAIFYGSLSVHIGVFLLLRTFPFWQDMLWARIFIGATGVLTGIVATLIARVQPAVKTQIAYSSAAQIGIIFFEVALGWHTLALVHFAGNAFLRTYQLLVSPSVLNYLVHHQYFHYHPPKQKPVSKLQAAVYMLGIKEWNLDGLMFRYLWHPFKWLGRQVKFLRAGQAMILVSLVGAATLLFALFGPAFEPSGGTIISAVLLTFALADTLFAFSYRGTAVKAWTYLLLAHLLIMAGIVIIAPQINTVEIIYYASGVAGAFVLGLYCLNRVRAIDDEIELNDHHGYVYEEKGTALLFLLATIGLLGFPVTAAFIGIDVFFTYVGDSQVLLVTLLGLCLLFIELAAVRIYLRIFLGPHKKLNHPVAFRSS